MKKLLALCLTFAINIAFAAPDIQTTEGRGLERARLETERTGINSKFDAQDRECQTRFVVTSCREDVKVQRIRSLDALTRQEAILNDIDRKATAAKQQQKLDEKTSASALAEKEKIKNPSLQSRVAPLLVLSSTTDNLILYNVSASPTHPLLFHKS